MRFYERASGRLNQAFVLAAARGWPMWVRVWDSQRLSEQPVLEVFADAVEAGEQRTERDAHKL